MRLLASPRAVPRVSSSSTDSCTARRPRAFELAVIVALILSGPSAGANPAPFPTDGTVLLADSERAEIQAVRPSGRNLVIASGFRGLSPRLSPDGRWLVATRAGELWLQPFGGDDSRARRVTKRGEYAIWSPDGRRLAFFRGRALWLIGVDSRKARLLWLLPEAMAPYPEGAIDWSPDGSRLVLSDAEGRLWEVGVTSPKLRRLGPVGLRGFTPRWSPGGAWVAVTDEDAWLTVLNVRSGHVRVLADEVDGHAWSPDGRFLAVSKTVTYECDDDPWEGCELGELSIVRLRNGVTAQQLRADALGIVFDWRPHLPLRR